MSTITPIVELTRPDHGRRYSPAEREVALMIYMGEGKRNLTRTAQLTGVSRFTLMKWADQDNWEDRVNGVGSAANETVALASAMFPHLFRAAAGAYLEILLDPKANANARVKLIEMTYGMYGMVAPKQSMTIVQHLTDRADQAVVSMKDLTDLDPDQLAAWEGGTDDDDTEGKGE